MTKIIHFPRIYSLDSNTEVVIGAHTQPLALLGQQDGFPIIFALQQILFQPFAHTFETTIKLLDIIHVFQKYFLRIGTKSLKDTLLQNNK